jgi:hypothetical protein
VKGETIEDMFADDVDLGDTSDFSTGEVVEVKKEETNSTVDITQILDNALNSDMFDNDDEAAEVFSIKKCTNIRLRLTPTNLNKADQHLEQFIINCINGRNTFMY